MSTAKRFRFLVSEDFLALLSKHVKDPAQRAQWLTQAVMNWDGAARGIPLSWRGKRHLNLDLDARGQKVMIGSDFNSAETFLSAVKQQIDLARRAPAPTPAPTKVGGEAAKQAKKAPATKAELKPQAAALAKPARKVASKAAKATTPSAPSSIATFGVAATAQAAPMAYLSLVEKAPTASSIEAQDLTADQVDVLHARLLDDQRDILARMGNARNQDTERAVDIADIASKSQDEEERQMFRVRLGAQLQQVVEALKRIKEGDYGWCEDTGEPIGWERLRANPTARYSVYAQARREQSERFRVA